MRKSTKQAKTVKADKVKNDLAFTSGDSEESQLARGLMGFKSKEKWSGIHLLPPASVLEDVVLEFEKKTDIPLEIPFMFTIEMILTHLISSGITIKLPGIKKPLECDSSVIIVADSGSSKTVGTTFISETFGFENLIWDSMAVSSAKFMEELCGVKDKDGKTISESNNRKVLFIDEFPEWFVSVRNPSSPMGDTYRDILKIYDNKQVGRETVKKNVSCEKPVVNIVGIGPYETFINELTMKDLTSGLIFRFAVMRAKTDVNRPIWKFPLYKMRLSNKKFSKFTSQIQCKEYILTSSVEKKYNKLFAELTKDADLPNGFLRRVMWRMHKFALVYHLLLGNGDKENISAAAYSYAARLTALNIKDYADMVKDSAPELRTLVEKVENFMGLRSLKGLSTKSRDLIANVRGVETIAMAEGLMRIVNKPKDISILQTGKIAGRPENP